MSGKDEKPVSVVVEDIRITCPGCRGTEWNQYQYYSSALSIDLDGGEVWESGSDWYEASQWECANCGGHAPIHILEKLEELR